MRKLAPFSLLAIGVLFAGACDDSGGGGGGGSGGRGGTGGGGGAVTGGSGGSGGGAGGSGGGTGGSGGGTGGSGGSGGASGSGGAAGRDAGGGSGGGGAGGGGAGGGGAGGGGAGGGSDGGGGTGGAAGRDGGTGDGSTAEGGASVPNPNAPCPKCVRIFAGMNFDGWEASPSTWSLVGGAMRGQGGTSRAAYTKKDYGNVRLIVTSRMNPVNGDHLGILFWGDRPTDPNRPKIDNAGWVQWMPPHGGMWSYHPPMHHGLKAMKLAPTPSSNTAWHTTELLLNLDKGTLRAAVNGIEISRYTHEWPTERVDPTKRIIRGPLAMMRHGGGGSEYKDIWVEDEPTEDKLYTVK